MNTFETKQKKSSSLNYNSNSSSQIDNRSVTQTHKQLQDLTSQSNSTHQLKNIIHESEVGNATAQLQSLAANSIAIQRMQNGDDDGSFGDKRGKSARKNHGSHKQLPGKLSNLKGKARETASSLLHQWKRGKGMKGASVHGDEKAEMIEFIVSMMASRGAIQDLLDAGFTMSDLESAGYEEVIAESSSKADADSPEEDKDTIAEVSDAAVELINKYASNPDIEEAKAIVARANALGPEALEEVAGIFDYADIGDTIREEIGGIRGWKEWLNNARPEEERPK